MIGKAPVSCDQCGKEKKATNDWYSMHVIDVDGVPRLLIDPGVNANFKTHVCGHNCCSILLSRWMTTGSLERKELVDAEITNKA